MTIHVLMENTAISPEFIAEHGLSLYIEACGKRILFDAGQSGAFAGNAEQMGIDLAAVDLCILSHGHYDHSGGLLRFLELNDHAPIYVQQKAFEPHFNASLKDIGAAPELAASPRIRLTGDALEIAPGLTLCTCNSQIAGVPASARGMSVRRGEGYIQDHFEHEQYLLIEENGKRIIVSGCSHKGILNIVRWLSPDVLIGGFHFMKLDPSGADAAYLDHAARALLAHPCTYYTGHCTGDAAYAFLKSRMGNCLHSLNTGCAFHI